MWYSYDKFGYQKICFKSNKLRSYDLKTIIYIPLGNIWYISGMYETKYVIEKETNSF